MLRLLKNLKFIGKNKNEVYASVAFVAVGLFISVATSGHGTTWYYMVLASCGCFAIGFFCALNAVADTDNMSLVERILITLWFILFLVLMLTVFSP